MLESKSLIMRRCTFALLTLITFIFQNISQPFTEIFGLRAMPLIPLAVCLGMFEGEFAGAFYGLFAGALWDTVAARGEGFHAVTLMLAGCVCGLLIRFFMRNNLACAFALSGAVIFLHNLLYWLLCVAISGIDGSLYALCRYYLPAGVYTVLFTPVFYFITREIMKLSRERAKR